MLVLRPPRTSGLQSRAELVPSSGSEITLQDHSDRFRVDQVEVSLLLSFRKVIILFFMTYILLCTTNQLVIIPSWRGSDAFASMLIRQTEPPRSTPALVMTCWRASGYGPWRMGAACTVLLIYWLSMPPLEPLDSESAESISRKKK